MHVYGHPTDPIFQPPTLTFLISNYLTLIFASDPINFYTESKKSMVIRSALINFFLLSAKPEIVVPGSGIRFWYFIFEIFGKPSFVEAVIWRVTQCFYLLCAQFRQKASGWINKTLLVTVNTHIFVLALSLFIQIRENS
jgi:hypothetical protein